MVTIMFPDARSNAAIIAVCWPKFPLKSTRRATPGRSAQNSRSISPDLSPLPSFTNMTSQGLPILSMVAQSLSKRGRRLFSSLYTGTTTEISTDIDFPFLMGILLFLGYERVFLRNVVFWGKGGKRQNPKRGNSRRVCLPPYMVFSSAIPE